MSIPTDKTLAHVSIVTAAFLTGATIKQINKLVAYRQVAVNKVHSNVYVALDDIERLVREVATNEE